MHETLAPGLGANKPNSSETFEAMCAARRAFARAWLDWLYSNPSAADVKLELGGTVKQVSSLSQLILGEEVR